MLAESIYFETKRQKIEQKWNEILTSFEEFNTNYT